MRRTKAGLSAVAIAASAAMVLAGCSQQSNQGGPQNDQPVAGFPETPIVPTTPGKTGGVFRFGVAEPRAIDSYNVQESEGSAVSEPLFTGLVNVDGQGNVSPGVATDWNANDNCSVWTFNLKPNTHFSNGEVVTADSFKRGWMRAAAPSSGSEVSYYLDEIQGYGDFQGGKNPDLVGVKVTNPNQLVVTLAEPDCDFDKRSFHPVFSPVPTTVGATTDSKYTDAPIGNGPFKIDGKWNHDKGVRLVRNDAYDAGPKAYLDAVEFTILNPANEVQLENDGFRNGTFDWARMPTPLIAPNQAEYSPKNEWLSRKTNGINYWITIDTADPLKSVDARKAISYAIDRDAIAKGVFKGAQAPADYFVPAIFPGAFQPGVCEACHFDPTKAKELAARAGLTPGTPLTISFNTGSGHEEWTAAVRQQIENTLGLKVNYVGAPFKDHINNSNSPSASGMYRYAWSADYPSPGGFLIPILAESSIKPQPNGSIAGDNKSRYRNADFDAVLTKARSTKDPAERDKLWKQAEQIAIGQDEAVIPMFERHQYRLIDNNKWGNANLNFNENPTLDVIYQK